MVYSDAFKAMPEEIHQYLFTRMGDIFTGREVIQEFALGEDERHDFINIIQQTLPEIDAYLNY